MNVSGKPAHIENRQQLIEYLESGCKPKSAWRLGTEHEKFGFTTDDLRPLPYEGKRSIRAMLEGLADQFGWKPVYEQGKIIALLDNGASVTLEPGGQLELSGGLLDNVHPNRAAEGLVSALFDAWSQRAIRMLKMPGGSPAWALLEAAKGSFVYVNLWPGEPAVPYDLAAGVALVRGAGGEVVDLAGDPIVADGHQGPFIAGIKREEREQVAQIARPALADT